MDTAIDIPSIPLPGITDANGNALSTGDRVHVTGSDSFGEGDGTVIGATAQFDYRIVPDGELRQVNEHKPVRIRIRLDDDVDDSRGDEYTASAGRVTKIDSAVAE